MSGTSSPTAAQSFPAPLLSIDNVGDPVGDPVGELVVRNSAGNSVEADRGMLEPVDVAVGAPVVPALWGGPRSASTDDTGAKLDGAGDAACVAGVGTAVGAVVGFDRGLELVVIIDDVVAVAVGVGDWEEGAAVVTSSLGAGVPASRDAAADGGDVASAAIPVAAGFSHTYCLFTLRYGQSKRDGGEGGG